MYGTKRCLYQQMNITRTTAATTATTSTDIM